MRLAFRVSYIGTHFCGLQMQPGLRTVESEFLNACMELNLFSDRKTARFAFSGRTDRGVHARGQVCAFTTEHPKRAISALNKKLPRDCWCTGWTEVDDTFHPRSDALTRTYRYYFYDITLDAEKMKEGARLFEGTHDFTRFSKPEENTPKKTILSSDVFKEDDFLVLEITGHSFLWNMVRCISYALLEVGSHRMTSENISTILNSTDGPRLPAAPPEGLVLWDAGYNIGFTPMAVYEKDSKYLFQIRKKYACLKKVTEIL